MAGNLTLCVYLNGGFQGHCIFIETEYVMSCMRLRERIGDECVKLVLVFIFRYF